MMKNVKDTERFQVKPHQVLNMQHSSLLTGNPYIYNRLMIPVDCNQWMI